MGHTTKVAMSIGVVTEVRSGETEAENKNLQSLSRHDRLVEWGIWEQATYDIRVRQMESLIKLLFVVPRGKGFSTTM
jgi:hypothetical protein